MYRGDCKHYFNPKKQWPENSDYCKIEQLIQHEKRLKLLNKGTPFGSLKKKIEGNIRVKSSLSSLPAT